MTPFVSLKTQVAGKWEYKPIYRDLSFIKRLKVVALPGLIEVLDESYKAKMQRWAQDGVTLNGSPAKGELR